MTDKTDALDEQDEDSILEIIQKEIGELDAVGKAFAELEMKLVGHSTKIITWCVAGMAAALLQQAYDGDRDYFDRSFTDAINRHIRIMKHAAGEDVGDKEQMN